jgi:hypothetical protein
MEEGIEIVLMLGNMIENVVVIREVLCRLRYGMILIGPWKLKGVQGRESMMG